MILKILSLYKKSYYTISLVVLRITIILFDTNRCLVLFILVSAFHFGDQQGLYLDFKVSKYLLIFYPFIYGIVILFLLFLSHNS
jgi:hypothetical protein